MTYADPVADPIRDLDIERAVLAPMILEPEQVEVAREIVKETDFTSSAHREVFRAVVELAGAGEAFDVTTVRSQVASKVTDAHVVLAEIIDRGAVRPSRQTTTMYATKLARMAHRRAVRSRAAGIVQALSNGSQISDRDLTELVHDLSDERGPQHGAQAVDLWSDAIIASRPEFRVPGLIRRSGLHMIWSQPSGNKTMLMLAIQDQMARGDGHLLGHPELAILSGWGRTLWIATEETASALKYRALAARSGTEGDTGRLFYIFAAGTPRVTLDDLPGILATQGPFDAVVLDSLTGLRPKERNGERIKWDSDNDSANDMCLLLRGLAAKYELAIFMLHHSDKLVKNYRGPIDWWASADVQAGLHPTDDGRVKVGPQKNRDGKVLDPFFLAPEWDGDRFQIGFDGEAGQDCAGLSPTAEKVHAFLLGRGPTPFYIIPDQIEASRSATHAAIQQLRKRGKVRETGETVKRSPVWQVSESVVGQMERGNGA